MEVTGKLVKKLATESGVSKSGKEWKKQSIVIDTGGEFNNEVCISALGDKMDSMNKLEIGMMCQFFVMFIQENITEDTFII